MRSSFVVNPRWTDVDAVVSDPTAAMLAIDVAGHSALRCVNMWSRSVQTEVHLSAEPLARWFLANWWRLRWEGLPPNGRTPHAWRMAHEMPAAGGGFLWPSLTFISDGESIRVEARPTPEGSTEMVRYQAQFDATIAANEFELDLDSFIGLVRERLDGSASGAALQDDIAILRDERLDPAKAAHRKLEALLGFDAGEAPDALLTQFRQLMPRLGTTTVEEVAAICNVTGPAAILQSVLELPDSAAAIDGQFDDDALSVDVPFDGPAAERGRRLATTLRHHLRLDGTAPMDDSTLAGLLGVPGAVLRPTTKGDTRFPLALAARSDARRGHRFVFRRRVATGRRFEAARLIADRMLDRSAGWHASTDADTARQKVQRSFAAEFLAPIDAISNYVRDDFSRDAIEGASEYFDVSTHTIASQLANHGRIRRNHPMVPQ